MGSIYQTFSSVEEGKVENVIKFALQPLLREGDGATLRVGARFEPRGSRRCEQMIPQLSNTKS